jgi:hypothetical protein
MAETGADEHNPSLRDVGFLAGEWTMELSNAAFLPNPSETVKGPVAFEWLLNGAFLVMRMGDKPPSPPAGIWLIGRDERGTDYTVFYYDARQVSRVYQMSFSDGIWKMWREAPGFSQRYAGKVSADGQTIAGYWEKSPDGAEWEHDFDVTYRRNE